MFFILFFTLFAAAQNVHAASSPVSDDLIARANAEEAHISKLMADRDSLPARIQWLLLQELGCQQRGNVRQQSQFCQERIKLIDELSRLQREIDIAIANQIVIPDGSFRSSTAQMAKDQVQASLVKIAGLTPEDQKNHYLAQANNFYYQAIARASGLPPHVAPQGPPILPIPFAIFLVQPVSFFDNTTMPVRLPLVELSRQNAATSTPQGPRVILPTSTATNRLDKPTLNASAKPLTPQAQAAATTLDDAPSPSTNFYAQDVVTRFIDATEDHPILPPSAAYGHGAIEARPAVEGSSYDPCLGFRLLHQPYSGQAIQED